MQTLDFTKQNEYVSTKYSKYLENAQISYKNK